MAIPNIFHSAINSNFLRNATSVNSTPSPAQHPFTDLAALVNQAEFGLVVGLDDVGDLGRVPSLLLVRQPDAGPLGVDVRHRPAADGREETRRREPARLPSIPVVNTRFPRWLL